MHPANHDVRAKAVIASVFGDRYK